MFTPAIRLILRDQSLIAIAGRVQRRNGIVNVLAERAVGLNLGAPDPDQPGQFGSLVVPPLIRSRDFR
jgi:hypothetical protein